MDLCCRWAGELNCWGIVVLVNPSARPVNKRDDGGCPERPVGATRLFRCTKRPSENHETQCRERAQQNGLNGFFYDHWLIGLTAQHKAVRGPGTGYTSSTGSISNCILQKPWKLHPLPEFFLFFRPGGELWCFPVPLITFFARTQKETQCISGGGVIDSDWKSRVRDEAGGMKGKRRDVHAPSERLPNTERFAIMPRKASTLLGDVFRICSSSQ